ncbi:MAG: hypothetical protein JO257_37485 [Deltaproteobacteria bacterium]|nr:hypothetical protein [Deltaproteobacteria bacterium]
MRVALLLAMLCARAAADSATGAIDAQLVTEIDLEPGHVARPFSLAPDLWWGAAPRWTIGLVHSHASVDRFEPGATLCLASSDPLACTHIYRGSGLDARYAALPWLAPRARLLLRDISPVKPAVTLGALVQGRWGRFALDADPYLQLGLANRDKGNDHALVLPVRAAVDLGSSRVWIDTGWNADFATWRDGWRVPVGAGVKVHVSSYDVGGELGFPSLLGPQNTPKVRELIVFVATRWQP